MALRQKGYVVRLMEIPSSNRLWASSRWTIYKCWALLWTTFDVELRYVGLQRKYPGLINRKRGLVLQDNTKPHTAKKTKEKFENQEGIQLPPHPAHSSDLAPLNYRLFRSMAHYLQGRLFNEEKRPKMSVSSFLTIKAKSGTIAESYLLRRDDWIP